MEKRLQTLAPGCYIDNMGYHVPLKGNSQLVSFIQTQLSLEKKSTYRGKRAKQYVSAWFRTGTELIVPHAWGVEKIGKPLGGIRLPPGKKMNVDFHCALRDSQIPAAEAMLESLKSTGRGILNAGCGFGKTNIALYLACFLGVKTLFLVDKTFLMDQIRDRIYEFTNCENVGIVQQQKVETDNDFVIGMIQTMRDRDYPPGTFDDFGFVIFDECHHMASETYQKCFRKYNSMYMMGMSADDSRADGLFGIVEWNLGKIVYRAPKRNVGTVYAKMIHIKSNNSALKVIRCYDKEVNHSAMVTNVTEFHLRTVFILKCIRVLLMMGRKILCLSERVQHLEIIAAMMDHSSDLRDRYGYFIGGKKNRKLLAEAATKDVVLGTFQMASEGLDIDTLNTVILCSPKSSVNQSVGRIIRKESYESLKPLIVDIVDDNNEIFYRQSNKRARYYEEYEYQVQHYCFGEREGQARYFWSKSSHAKYVLKDVKKREKEARSKVEEFDVDLESSSFLQNC